MLGSALTTILAQSGASCSPFAEAHLDITHVDALTAAVSGFAAEGGRVVINAAAYTNVEQAEDDVDKAFMVNDQGARNVAAAAAQFGLKHVYVSTDFVFDGAKPGPYTEDDQPNPLSVYGRSKLAGEKSVLEVAPESLIVRTAWVYGPCGNNFASKIFSLAASRDQLKVVDDEVGCPTFTFDLANGILGLIERDARGLFNLTGSGSCSRYEMAKEVIAAAGLATEVLPVSSDAFPTKAVRPHNSVLSLQKAQAIGVSMPAWQESLRFYVKQHLMNAA
jgi:dTDP-4-dehydrorhamnose reductase